jgi:hypothetical protein
MVPKRKSKFFEVKPINLYTSSVGIIEAIDKVENGSLPRAAPANNCNKLSWFDCKVKPL